MKNGSFKNCFFTLVLTNAFFLIFVSMLYAQESELLNSEAILNESQGLVKATSSVSTGPFEVSLSIDTEPCKTWPTQCSNTGHTAYGASQSNHNPIRINVQVLSKTGTPVNNLSFGNFNISCPLMPPSAPPIRKLECSDCFLAGGDGVYAFFVHPDPSSGIRFWQPGTYSMQVQVSTSKSKIVRVFAPFTIP